MQFDVYSIRELSLQRLIPGILSYHFLRPDEMRTDATGPPTSIRVTSSPTPESLSDATAEEPG